MGTPEDFMQQVVAWPGPDGPGWVNLHWVTPHIGRNGKPLWGGKPYKDVKSFMDMVQWGAGKPSVMKDIYFCLSTQSSVETRKNGKLRAMRSAATALVLKAIWLDVDVGKDKGYATLEEALLAVSKFYHDANLPPPSAFVFSGGGVHAYWISDIPLTVSEWRPYAEGLRAEASRLGLRFDEGVTTDAARILRVPGTFNYKATPPRSCRLANLGRSFDFAVDLGRLASVTPVKVTAAVTQGQPIAPFNLSAFVGKRPCSLLAHLNPLDGLTVYERAPLSLDAIIQNCPHFQEAMLTHGAGYGQGLWMLDVMACTFLDDGRRWAHYASKGHKTYDPADTDAMYDRKEADGQKFGWPSCTAFENEGCKLCKTCIFKGTIKSPLNLAGRVCPSPVAAWTLPPPPAALRLPPQYTVNADGYIGLIVEQKLPGGQTEPQFIPFFNYKVHSPWTDDAGFHFKADVDISTTKTVTVLDEQMASLQTLVASLCKQRCHPDPRGEKYLVAFMRSWTKQRDDEIKRLVAVPYGWVFTNGKRSGFAYGGKVFEDTGEIRDSGAADPMINEAYMPMGEITPFLELMDIIGSQNNPGIEVLVAASFAAPLMAISGEDNGMFWGWSNASGAHKSTSILTGAAVWGDPKQAKEKSTTSVLYLEKKLGILRNLPVVMDEIRETKQIDAISAHLGNFTEGSSGGKLRRDRSMHEKQEWQTLMVAGANQSLRAYTLKNNKDTDAALMRVFEVELPRLADTHSASHVKRLVDSLSQNYGQVGLMYAEHLGKHHKSIFATGMLVESDFQKEVKFQSHERFWSALCVAILYGAHLANHVLSKTYFHIDLIHDFLVEKYMDQREFARTNMNIAGTALNVEDTLGQFFKSVSLHHLWTETMPKKGPGRPTTVTVVKLPEKLPVHVRWGQHEQILQISKASLSDFCEKQQQAYHAVLRGLVKNFAVTQVRISLSAGVHSIGQSAETAIEMSIPPSSPFYDILMTGKAPSALPAAPTGLVP